jgi:hypothetical protein
MWDDLNSSDFFLKHPTVTGVIVTVLINPSKDGPARKSGAAAAIGRAGPRLSVNCPQMGYLGQCAVVLLDGGGGPMGWRLMID